MIINRSQICDTQENLYGTQGEKKGENLQEETRRGGQGPPRLAPKRVFVHRGGPNFGMTMRKRRDREHPVGCNFLNLKIKF